MIIAIDVDQTVVETFTPWMKYIERLYPGLDLKGRCNNYQLGYEINIYLRALGIEADSCAYWRHTHLYDHLEPIEGSVEAINRLGQNHQIVFVSKCFPEHESSKLKFLEKHFRLDGFVSTKDKQYVQYDMFIDDTPSMIEKCSRANLRSGHILFTGQYDNVRPYMSEKAMNDIYETSKNFNQISSWKEITQWIA
jgi:5'(3')-deoxyribonucleotidase